MVKTHERVVIGPSVYAFVMTMERTPYWLLLTVDERGTAVHRARDYVTAVLEPIAQPRRERS
jgi:hypothetical protein